MRGAHNGAGSADAVEATPVRDEQSAAIARLAMIRDPAEVEHLADELANHAVADQWNGAARDELIEALVRCLTGDSIRQDADVEDAICSALAQLGVMTRVDNLVFEFVPDGELATSDLAPVRRYRDWLPRKYTTIQPGSNDRAAAAGIGAIGEQEVTPWSTE